MNEEIYIETIQDLEEKHSGEVLTMQKLKQMAARNVVRWVSKLDDPWIWEGIEYDEREGRYVATFDFEKIEEEKDTALSGYITATVHQFDITKEDFQEALNTFEENVREEIERVRGEIEDLREEELSEEQEEFLDRQENRLQAKENQLDMLEEARE